MKQKPVEISSLAREEDLKQKIAAVNLDPIPEPVAQKIDELFFQYVANPGNVHLRNQIVLKNQALVGYIINKYYSGKKELKERREDLLQEGIIGLLSAIDGYKPELGFRFSTYATWWIRQSVTAYLQSMIPPIHIPSHVRTAQNKVARVMAAYKIPFEEAIKQTAEKEGYTDKMVASISAAMLSKNVVSLEEKFQSPRSAVGNTEEANFRNSLPDVVTEQSDDTVDNHLLLDAVKETLLELSEKERYILLLRFDIIGENDIGENREEVSAP